LQKGIAKSFQGAGDYINSYGNAARSATAPNAGSYAKRVEARSKPASKVGEKKALPSSGQQKALPSTKPLKALPAPPAKKDDAKKTAIKPTSSYQSAGDSYKSKAGAYSAPAAKKAEPIKSRTLQSGKVAVSKESLPQNLKAKGPSGPAATKPYPSKTPPLNLPPASSPKPAIPGFGFGDKAGKAPSKAGSVVGGPQKTLGGYSPGIGLDKPGAKAPSRAPTVIGAGNKLGTKPPPSKAGSVAGTQAGGGPKFF
jgi:hypothetical protein